MGEGREAGNRLHGEHMKGHGSDDYEGVRERGLWVFAKWLHGRVLPVRGTKESIKVSWVSVKGRLTGSYSKDSRAHDDVTQIVLEVLEARAAGEETLSPREQEGREPEGSQCT